MRNIFTFTQRITAVATLCATVYLNAQSFTISQLHYEVVNAANHTVQVGESPDAHGDIVIPEKVTNGGTEYTVVSIGSGAFYNNANLTGVEFAPSITSIGTYAFAGCGSLTSVDLNEGLKKIGSASFSSCTALPRFTIPASVETIDNNAFTDSWDIAVFKVVTGNNYFVAVDGILYNKAMTTLVKFPAGKSVTTFVVPDTVTEIGVAGLEGGQFTDITLPESLITLNEAAFANCLHLTNINIPDSVTTIGKSAFLSCLNLKIINLPASLVNLGSGAFKYSSMITAINIADSNSNYSTLEGVLFNKSKTKLIQFPVAVGGHYALPDTVTEIENSAMMDASSLTSIDLPASLQKIGKFGMYNMSLLTTISCAAATPPQLMTASLDGMPRAQILLNVPVGSGSIYQSTSVWSEFNIKESSLLATSNANEISARIFPNPTSDVVYVLSPNSAEVALYNLAGQKILNKDIQKGKTQLDLSKEAPGVYMLRVGNKTYKVIKK